MALTLGQAAKIAGVSKPTMSKWLKDGKLSGSKNADGVYEIDRSDLDRFLAFNRSSKTVLGSVNGNGNLGVSHANTNPQNATQVPPKPTTGVEALDNADKLETVKYAAAIEILRVEKAALEKALAKSETAYEHLEARMDDMQASYEETLRQVTRLLEDKRPASERAATEASAPTKKRKKFLGIF